MELLKYYVVLRQDKDLLMEGLLINDLKQGIHYYTNGCLTYLDNMKNGLKIELRNKNIMHMTYFKNNKLHGKHLIWYNGERFSNYRSYSNDEIYGIYYEWFYKKLVYISSYNNGLLHGTGYDFIHETYKYYIHGEEVNKFIYDVWRYGRKLYSKIFFKI